MTATGRQGDAERWQAVPTVWLVAPTCPHCRTVVKPIIVRSQDEGDGTQTRRCVCRACSRRFLTIIELPETGNTADPFE